MSISRPGPPARTRQELPREPLLKTEKRIAPPCPFEFQASDVLWSNPSVGNLV